MDGRWCILVLTSSFNSPPCLAAGPGRELPFRWRIAVHRKPHGSSPSPGANRGHRRLSPAFLSVWFDLNISTHARSAACNINLGVFSRALKKNCGEMGKSVEGVALSTSSSRNDRWSGKMGTVIQQKLETLKLSTLWVFSLRCWLAPCKYSFFRRGDCFLLLW